jgi:hypothetical protein
MKPVQIDEPWNLTSPNQWGEAYLLLSTDRDIRYMDEKENNAGESLF